MAKKGTQKRPNLSVLGVNDPLTENFQNSAPKEFTSTPIHVSVPKNIKIHRPEMLKVVRGLVHKKVTRQSASEDLLWRPLDRSRSNFTWPPPLRDDCVCQVSSRSVKFARSYCLESSLASLQYGLKAYGLQAIIII